MHKLKISILLLLAAVGVAMTGCHSIDDQRIPAAPVSIVFTNVGVWDKYGVAGALDTRRFIKEERVPAGFPYLESTYTGFGGVLLAADLMGNPVAYDLSCPVECRRDVRVAMVPGELYAECPVCHSTYSVFENYGYPLSGIAAERGYGLQRYNVHPSGADYYVITR